MTMNFMQANMKIMKILCSPNRFAIIALLSKSTKEDLCVNQISQKVGISQSLASHQLSYLEASGVVVSTRMGQLVCYSLASTSLVKTILKVIKLLG